MRVGVSRVLTSQVTTASKKPSRPAAFKEVSTCRRLPPVATAQGSPAGSRQQHEDGSEQTIANPSKTPNSPLGCHDSSTGQQQQFVRFTVIALSKI